MTRAFGIILKEYLNITDYSLLEEEFGVIPMTDHVFTPVDGNIVHLGTAGGQTKPSSGYTFRFILEACCCAGKSVGGFWPSIHETIGVTKKIHVVRQGTAAHAVSQKDTGGKDFHSLVQPQSDSADFQVPGQ